MEYEIFDDQLLTTNVMDVLRKIDFSHFAYHGVDSEKEDGVFLLNYPDRWIEHYSKNNYQLIDPIEKEASKSSVPLDWDYFSNIDPYASFFMEARQFGMGSKGLTIPVIGKLGIRGFFSACANFSEADWQRHRLSFVQDLVPLAYFVDHKMQSSQENGSKDSLSKREVEYLYWASRGKSNEEIAKILGVTNNTCVCFSESSKHKFGVFSKTHAVAVAISRGIIPTLD